MNLKSLENINQQPKSPELETVLNFFDLRDIDLKDATKILLQQAYEIFNTKSKELLQERQLEIDGEIFTLQYNIYPPKSSYVWVRVSLFKNQTPESIQNTTAFNEGEVTMTRLLFDLKKCLVSGEVLTEKNFEGCGFGSALLLMREGIIHDIIQRYREKVTPASIKSIIKDNSRSLTSEKNYKGWTSSMAEKMGYEKIDEKKFTKSYNTED